jgi:effector-binding domain-containing protein
MTELDAVLTGAGIAATGPCGGLYDNELFSEERGLAIVFIPVPQSLSSGRVSPFVVPPAELAVTVHRGSHDDIDVTYGALGAYVSDHELVVAGPVRETYLVGPRDISDEAAWRTEIGWPVFRTAVN